MGDADWIQSAAAQLLQLAPDVILANGTPAAKTMQQSSRTVPVIFIAGSDPVVDGLVLSLAHPGGNLTGLYFFEPSLGAKLLELLKEIAPQIARVAILFNPDAHSASWFAAAAAVTPRFSAEVVEAPLRDPNRNGDGPVGAPAELRIDRAAGPRHQHPIGQKNPETQSIDLWAMPKLRHFHQRMSRIADHRYLLHLYCVV